MKRIKPRCPYYGSCGGCQLQHLAYEDQLELKTRMIRECMEQARPPAGGQGLAGIEIRPTLGMKDPWFYRNKIQFPIRQQNNRLEMGYFKQKTHEVVNIKECYIQDPFLTEAAQIAREVFEKRGLSAYDEKSGKGLLRHFIGRSGFRTDELLLGIVVNSKGLPAGFTVAEEIKKRERLLNRMVSRHQDYPEIRKPKRIVGIVQNTNTSRSNVIMGKLSTTLLGSHFLREKLGRYKFNIQLNSFFQVNPVQAAKLYDLVREFAEAGSEDTAVDAYAGIGAIAFWLAEKAGSVIAVEETEAAAKDAKRNIDLNQLANVAVRQGLIEKEFPDKAGIVVLDPPRGGCSEKALKLVCKAGPRRIVYVSCNPQSMARDLAYLAQNGYAVDVIQPVDMFPQTEHVEAVARLSRGG